VRFLILATIFGCAADSGESAASASSLDGGKGPPAITLREVEFVQSRGNAVFARGRVSEMTYISESGDTVARDATIRFPREQHPGSAVDVSAPRAQGNPLEARVTGEGGVHFENQQGDRGQTERATYEGRPAAISGESASGARGEGFGDRPVQLFGPGFVLKSPGFSWHQATDLLDLGPSEVVTKGQSK
jgi:hypothetical protein